MFDQQIVDVCERFLKKGRKVYLEGQLQTRKWTDQSGVEKYSTEVVLQRYRGELTMLDSRSEGGGAYDSGAESSGDFGAPSSTPGPAAVGGADIDDEIPF